ncbi:hypothetical protein DU002_06225 [Corallincola holothuriorum]|uniref:Uncharacterized protein n=1 Tax=Corallincola holothuriorum TaxID=2282215 RepID=A0A368NN79_9GAMM|nr:hypothetical protein [Corallincola holothuriorum]RCU50919.1 hypothetical protein DU002_06225 [Corallincola holothuriorum]
MKTKRQHKPRNLHAISPLMNKGGAHGKSQKAQRSADKLSYQQEWLDWETERLSEQCLGSLKETEGDTPSDYYCCRLAS